MKHIYSLFNSCSSTLLNVPIQTSTTHSKENLYFKGRFFPDSGKLREYKHWFYGKTAVDQNKKVIKYLHDNYLSFISKTKRVFVW